MGKKAPFVHHIEAARKRMARLAARAAALPKSPPLLTRTLAELSETLEELQTAGEDLRRQNDELIATRQAEEEERRRYRDLFDFAPDAYLVTDFFGAIREANRAAASLLSLPRRALVGTPILAFVAKEDRKPFLTQMSSLNKGARRLEDWEVYLKPRGKKAPFPAGVTVAAVENPRGKLIGLRWLIRDHTERKQQELLARLASFPELNPNPIVEVDLSGHIFYQNPAAQRLFPDLSSSMLQYPWLVGLEALTAEMAQEGKNFIIRELKIGEAWYEQFIYSVMEGARFRVFGQDITERKRMEDELRRSRDELEQRVRERTYDLNGRIKELNTLYLISKFLSTQEGSLADVLEEIVHLLPQGWQYAEVACARITFEGREYRSGDFAESPWKQSSRIFVAGKPSGQVEVFYPREMPGSDEGPFLNEERTLIEAIAAQLGEYIEHRQADEALRASKELLESIFANVHFSIAALDKDFNFVRVNRAFAEADDRAPDFYPGRNYFALFPHQLNEEIFRQVVRTGVPYFAYETPFLSGKHPERPLTYWDWSLQPVKGVQGRVSGVILSLVDVTEHKLSEEARLRLAAAVEQSREGVVILDPEGSIRYLNPGFESINGLAPREVLGKKYADLLAPEMTEKGTVNAIQQRIQAGETWSGHLSRKGKNGRVTELNVAISPVRNHEGRIIDYLVVERDETKAIKMEQQIRQVEKMQALGTLAGGIAHDFNNILMAIVLNTENALADIAEGTPARSSLKDVLQATAAGQNLVRQIMAFSRPSEVQAQATALVPVIKESLKLIRATTPTTIAIQQNLQPQSAMAKINPSHLQQILVNLCGNAAYAMRGAKGLLEVGLTQVDVDEEEAVLHPDLEPGSYLKLTVKDSGPGMEPAVMERIFEPFFTTKKAGEGSGMGLAVVHGILKAVKGAVEVKSKPGEGATFEVFLPRIVEAPPAPESSPGQPLPGGNERVLIVDDEVSVMHSLRLSLERLGYRVTATSKSPEALALFRANPGAFELVITDQIMPQLTGTQLAEELLRTRPDLPIILCTGYGETVGETEAKAGGIREFIMKPFRTEQIAATIRRVLR